MPLLKRGSRNPSFFNEEDSFLSTEASALVAHLGDFNIGEALEGRNLLLHQHLHQ